MIDIVFPRNNEKEFIAVAERLGYSDLCFAYEYRSKETLDQKNNLSKLKINKLNLFFGLLAKPSEVQKLQNKADLILVKSSDKNRFVLEKAKPDILFDLENHNQRDYIHHRASGLNHILCNIAAKNNIIIAFPLSALLNANTRKKSKILGRFKQNIRLCRKYKVKLAIASFAQDPYQMRAPNDMISLALTQNADTKQAKEALESPLKAIEAKKRTNNL